MSPEWMSLATSLLITYVVSNASDQEQMSLEGAFSGTARVGAAELEVRLAFRRDASRYSGTFESLALGVTDFPLSEVRVEGPEVELSFRSDRGPNTVRLTLDGDRLEGVWIQPGSIRAEFLLNREEKSQPRREREDIAFENDHIMLAGSVFLPEASPPWPLVIFVHGSGNETREASRFLATYFADNAIAAIAFDKRGTGQSRGAWMECGFETLARDVLAAVQWAKSDDRFDSTRIGLHGLSQGGWIAPLAASLSNDIAFVITKSGALVTPAIEGHWDSIRSLRLAGWQDETVARVASILDLMDEAVRTGSNFDSYEAEVAKVASEPWFEDALLKRGLVPGGFWDWYRKILDFDPVPVFRGLEIPVLALWGENDESIPVQESDKILRTLGEQDDRDITIRIYEGADHSLRIAPPTDGPFDWRRHPAGYPRIMIDWLESKIL